MTTRYAIYFLPEPASALMRLGQVWLDHLPRQLTAEARPYGFHACADFAARHRGVVEAPPNLAVLNGFFALRPSLPSDAIQSLGAACVRDFDRFRAPLTPAERAKRLKSPLSARSRQLLEDWGYPYVFEEYRFHMTLTCRVDDSAQAEVAAMLQPLVAEACAENLEIRSICLVRQDPGSDFALVERFALGAPCAS